MVDLPLPEDFQVGVGLVEQQNRFGIGIQVREEQEGLLQPTPGARQVEDSRSDLGRSW